MSWLQGLKDKKFGSKDGKANYKWIAGGGLTAGYAFNENVGIGIEVLYTSLGATTKEKLENDNNSGAKAKQFHIRTHNLVVPLMVKFFPMGYDPDAGILNIHLGIQGEMPLFGAKVSNSKLVDDKIKLEKDENFKKEYLKPITVSPVVGIGYEFPEIGISLEGRGSLGLMDIFDNKKNEVKDYKESNGFKGKGLKNASFVVSLGYNFAGLLMN